MGEKSSIIAIGIEISVFAKTFYNKNSGGEI
jgi:hypothetical protein